MRAQSTVSRAARRWHSLVGIIGTAQRGWLRWQCAVSALYHQRVTLPLQYWQAFGCPPEFTPQLPWWHSFVWRYLVITGMRSSRVARPPVEQRGPEHYPVRFMQ